MNLCRFRAERVPGDCTGVPNVFVDGYRMAAEDGAAACAGFGLCSQAASVRHRWHYPIITRILWNLAGRFSCRGSRVAATRCCPMTNVIQANAEELRSQILPIDADDATSQVQFVEMLVRNIPAPSELTPHVLDRRRFLTKIQFCSLAHRSRCSIW